MRGRIEGILTPATFPLPEFDGQLALLVDAWVREWRSCECSVHLTPQGIGLGQLMFFRDPTFDRLADDDAYPAHLRLYGREELSGARKMLLRLLSGNPGAMRAIAHHLIAEAVAVPPFTEDTAS